MTAPEVLKKKYLEFKDRHPDDPWVSWDEFIEMPPYGLIIAAMEEYATHPLTGNGGKTDELLPCPFCGGTEIDFIRNDEKQKTYYCATCCAEGPIPDPQYDWNTRATAPQVKTDEGTSTLADENKRVREALECIAGWNDEQASWTDRGFAARDIAQSTYSNNLTNGYRNRE